MIEAVIFDVDGTLVDSVDLHARAWVEAFRDYGIAIKFEDMRRQIGKGGDQIVRMFLSDQQIANFGERLEQHRAQLLKDRYIPQIEPLAGGRALFEHLLRNGKKIALASSAKEDELAKYKQIACIDDLIDTETSSDNANNSKPHPDMFHEKPKASIGGLTAGIFFNASSNLRESSSRNPPSVRLGGGESAERGCRPRASRCDGPHA